MDYRKEKNFVVAYDGDKVRGKFNFSTASYIGVKGGVVVNKPKAFTKSLLEPVAEENIYAKAMCMVADMGNWYINNHPECFSRLEAMISVGLFPRSSYDLETKTRLTKDLVNYLKDNHNSIYSRDVVDNWVFDKKYGNLLDDLNENSRLTFRCLITRNNPLPVEYVVPMLRQCQHEHVETLYRDLAWFVREYYDTAKYLYGNVKVNPNIATNYGQMLFIKRQREKEEQMRNLKEYNDQPWLYFETEKYTIFPLTTTQQFHEEGEHQHNCVEWMYMEKVVKKQTHVVVVREKENPDKSFVTCEVRNDGHIQQFLKTCNACVRQDKDPELYALKLAYQTHLINNIPELV